MKTRNCANPDCPLPQPLPLTKEYWYGRSDKPDQWNTPCKRCWCKRVKAKGKQAKRVKFTPTLAQIEAGKEEIFQARCKAMLD